MTDTKHTPGPWRINGSLITSQEGMALSVASVYPPKIGNAARDMAERDANAHLIAAAPELLEALVRLITLNATQGVSVEDYEAAQDAAETAIAKAEGLKS